MHNFFKKRAQCDLSLVRSFHFTIMAKIHPVLAFIICSYDAQARRVRMQHYGLEHELDDDFLVVHLSPFLLHKDQDDIPSLFIVLLRFLW